MLSVSIISNIYYFWLCSGVMSFLQLHDLLDADEHCVETVYKIVDIFVGAFSIVAT